MFLRLLLLFTIVPFVELTILVWIADKTNWMFAVGLVLLTGIAGAALARHEGLRCLRQIQDRLRRGEVPADSLLDGLLILVAGVLLVTPGVLSDLTGLLLLLPPVRRRIGRYAVARIRARFRAAAPYAGQPGGDRIVDVRIVDVEASEPDGEKKG